MEIEKLATKFNLYGKQKALKAGRLINKILNSYSRGEIGEPEYNRRLTEAILSAGMELPEVGEKLIKEPEENAAEEVQYAWNIRLMTANLLSSFDLKINSPVDENCNLRKVWLARQQQGSRWVYALGGHMGRDFAEIDELEVDCDFGDVEAVSQFIFTTSAFLRFNGEKELYYSNKILDQHPPIAKFLRNMGYTREAYRRLFDVTYLGEAYLQ